MALTQTKVSQLYVSIFNRASEGTGNTYWQTAHTNATTTAEAMFLLPQVATFFGVTNFTDTANVRTVIEAIYLNSLGKSPTDDAAGITYWIGQVTGGRSIGDVVNTLVIAATDTVNAGTAQDVFNNKVTVSNFAADNLSKHTTDAAFQAFLTGVTSVASTVTAANTSITAAIPVASNPGSTFSLTTTVDTIAGTALDDIYIADNSVTAAPVMSAADTLTGGNGNDTLKIYSDGTIESFGALSSIETVSIFDEDTDIDLSITNFASATATNFTRSDGALDITVGVGVANVGLEDMVLSGAGGLDGVGVTAAAAATSLTLDLNKITAAGNDADENITVVGAGLTTVTINATGTASAMDTIVLPGATTVNVNASVALTTVMSTTGVVAALNITGAGAVGLGLLDTGFDTVTATSSTGGLTASIGAAVDTVMTLGSGNDVITASTTDALVAANTLSVDGGEGSNTLVLGDAADVNTAADAARYTNFDTLAVVDDINTSLVAGITTVSVGANTSAIISALDAAKAANITMSAGNTTSTIFTLLNATGTSDVLSLDLNAGALALTTEVDIVGVSAIGFETVNVANTTGEALATNAAGGNTAFGFLANTADSVGNLNFTGANDITLNIVADTLDVVAVAVDASGMTGLGDVTFTLAGGMVVGSSFKGTANNDSMNIGTINGTSYLGMAGNDTFDGALAALVQTGSSDHSINGGLGTDKVTVTDTGALTLTDNHFMGISNMEELLLTATGAGNVSVTTGAAFNSAYSDGVTITTGALANDDAFLIAAGLATVDMSVTASAALLLGDDNAADDITITTGSGDDTVSVIGTAFVSAAAGGSIDISTGAGADSITVTTSTLAANNATQVVSITAGTGADTISKTSTANAANALANTIFNVAAGDSTTAARDTITGFLLSDGTYNADEINVTGTALVASGGTSVNVGVIQSHSFTTGVITFDDVDTFATALSINSGNLADVISYLETNITTNAHTAAFAYDSTGSGVADATMVFNSSTAAGGDSLIELVGVTGVTAVVVAATTTANQIFVL